MEHFIYNKTGKQGRVPACELTVNCMSLSLLEVDLGKKGLEAGKHEPQGQHQQEYVCLNV